MTLTETVGAAGPRAGQVTVTPACDRTGDGPEAVFASGLRAYLGAPSAIASIVRSQIEASTHAIERWHVTLDSGECLRVLFKSLHPDSPCEPDALPERNPREVLVYERLLSGERFGAPPVFASRYDESRGQYWLFIGDLGDQTLDQCGTEVWLAAARRLAAIAAAYPARAAELRALRCLGEHDGDFYLRHAATARRALRLHGDSSHLERCELLMRRFAPVVEWLVRQPRTLVHGDIFAGNLIVRLGMEIRPIDWEWAAIGTCGWDIARLLYGWEDYRSDLLDAFAGEYERILGAAVNRDALRLTVACCHLIHAVRFVGLAAEDGPASVAGALDDLDAAFRAIPEVIQNG